MDKCILAAILLALVGCATKQPSGNVACAYVVDLPDRFENCAGTIDVRFHYINGSLVGFDNEVHRTNPKLSTYYVAQRSEHTCFAAALEIALSYFGFTKTQEDYVNALGDECFVARGQPATFSQVVFSATRALDSRKRGRWWFDGPNNPVSAYLNSVINDVIQYEYSSDDRTITNKPDVPVYWQGTFCHSPRWLNTSGWMAYVDMPSLGQIMKSTGSSLLGSLYPQWLTPSNDFANRITQVNWTFSGNLYRPHTWTRSGGGKPNAGGIAPITGVSELIRHFENGVPIVAGLTNNWSGHVVVIDQIWYVKSDTPSEETSPPELNWVKDEFGLGATLTRVRVMDPATPQYQFREFDGDVFLKSAGFMFAVYGG